MLYVLIVCIVCALIFAKMALVIIPQSETKIIERLGRYHATLNPGINVIIPFIDKAKTIVVIRYGQYSYSSNIDLREQVYDFPKQNVITKDNVQTESTHCSISRLLTLSKPFTKSTICPMQ